MVHSTESKVETNSNTESDFENTGACCNIQQPQWPRRAFIVCVAIIIVGFLVLNQKGLSGLLTRFFGPPKVELRESYAETPDGAGFDHSTLNVLLADHVDSEGLVNYRQLKTREKQLDAYIESLGRADFEALGRGEKLAFLINAYNAFTLKLILENYPLDSIKDIPDAQRWDAVRWNLAGETVSLNQIEHEHVRPNFREPRIHFALVCAAMGCPPLRNEAYTGQDIETQLSEQAEYVHNHSTWFNYDNSNGKLQLTKLYNWYGDDFVQVAGSIDAFAANYSPELREDLHRERKPSISWLQYDWALNDQKNRSAR